MASLRSDRGARWIEVLRACGPPLRIVILGNSGSGKSTVAGQLADRAACDVLDLDTVAWEPGQIASPRAPESARADVQAFCRARPSWIFEGCYGDLVAATFQYSPTLLFMDPGAAACLANCRSRPWEPHKYASRAAQDERLEFLLGWVSDYYLRDADPSFAAHDDLYRGYRGTRQRLRQRPAADYLPPIPGDRLRGE